ncbi:MAG TPA: TlpA disulfide reductase family protein [Burkholderiales bacterium]|nr:TlpA disulfide reductase family protein [Burkholderiales bacterium]
MAAGAALGGVALALYQRSAAREWEALSGARLTDLQGKQRTLEEWSGKLVLVNFWATWCAPCLEEIPMLIELRRAYGDKGLEVVGIAIDQEAKVREMAAKLSVEYPILLADSHGLQLLRELGNSSGGLPYTLILDRKQQASGRKLGALKRPEAEAMVTRALAG